MNANTKTPGEQFKTAREEQGKSLSEMAKITRIGVQQLQGLEEDNYDRIPAPMYVRGFIKLYAKKLGLNPDPLLDLYERMSNGKPLLDEPAPLAPAPARAAETVRKPIRNPDDAFSEHPEITRQAPETNPSVWSLFSEHAVQVLHRFKRRINLDWLKSPRTKYIMGGGLFILLFLFGLRSCYQTEREDSGGSGVIEVDEPLLTPPEPVYFQLPSSTK